MKSWEPIIKYLEEKTGEKIELKIENSIPKFEEKLYSGYYDIAYMNPYHYVVANKKQGYLAKFKSIKDLVGILVVNNSSNINDIRDVKGKRFLFPSPNALAATIITKYELLKNYNINVEKEETFEYVNSHDSVYKGVARGIGDVGGGIERTFDALTDIDAKNSLKILYTTQSYPSHPIVFSNSISKVLEKKLEKAFLNIPQNLLEKINIENIVKTDDKEYDIIRDLAEKLTLPKD